VPTAVGGVVAWVLPPRGLLFGCSLTPTVRTRIDLGAIDGRGAHRGGGNYIAAVCRCAKPRRIRVARSVFELADITCGACAQPFAEVE
jgi:hypothetical protein